VIRRFLGRLFKRRPARPAWALTEEQVRAGFDRVREAVPVDDDELERARPVTKARRWRG
jgi:hypothetical protein